MRSLMPGLGPGVLGLKQKLSLLPQSSKSVSGGSVTLRPILRPGFSGEPAAEVLLGLILQAAAAAHGAAPLAEPAAQPPLMLQVSAAAGAVLFAAAAAGLRWDIWALDAPVQLSLGLGSDTVSPDAASGRLKSPTAA